ncbi:MAG: REP-associated tyrosine transposase [Planctomycetota bacterium]|jgi:putative transposase
MSRYLRNYVPGGTYFFTVVTHQRRPILGSDLGRCCLRQAFDAIRKKRPFDLLAIVLVPEHVHTVWTLPPDDSDYSLRWGQIKERFSRVFLRAGGTEGRQNPSRVRHRERAIWQRRFWEHTCRDEDELKRCVDYIHWNPVKHGLVARPADYPYSSFHRFVNLGEYPPDWGKDDPCPGLDDPEWE